MKRSLLVAAVLASFAGAVFAQSSLTIYGRVDVGLVGEGGAPAAGKTLKVTSGVAGGSRLGFRGVEDLGGGMKARFQLETGYCSDSANGAATYCGGDGNNNFMSRMAIVALDGGFGSVQLGRQYTLSYLHLDHVDPFNTGLAGAATNIFPFMQRMDNGIVYSTPNMGGFNAALAYSAGEVTGKTSGDRGVDLSVSYNMGPLYVGLTHIRANDAMGDTEAKATNVGAMYDFGMAKAHVMHQTTKTDLNTPTQGDEATTMIGVSAPVGQGRVMASYTRHNDKAASNEDANQFGIGYVHALSKRTQIYTAYAKISNKNGATKTVGNATEAGTGEKAFNFGVIHSF